MHFGPRIATDGCVASIDGSDNGSFEVLVVGGGGGGGMDMGGGGGGGGVLYFPAMQLNPGTSYTVTVGIGGYGAPAGSGGVRTDGAGPQPGGHQFTIRGTNGGDSSFAGRTALGGGYGGSSYWGYTPDFGYGGSGGSGGGASGYSDGTGNGGAAGAGGRGGTASQPSSTYSGYGNRGGGGTGQYFTGGGGGAGGRGGEGTAGGAAAGGNGVEISILGTSYFWGGGGGGAPYSTSPGGNGGIGGGGGGALGTTSGGVGLNNGAAGGGGSCCSWAQAAGGNGGANTGGGGGGGSHYNATNKGGEGGSGIVVVAYKGPQRATGGTVDTTSRPGFTLHKFTSTGNSTFTTYASDSSPNLYHCTFNGNAYFTTDGGNGGVFVLDGTGDYLVNSGFTRHQQSTGTIMAWAYPTVITGDYYVIGTGGTTTNGATRAIRINSNTWSCVTYNIDYNGIVGASLNTWQHVAFVWNGTTVNFYFNGTLYSSTLSMVSPLGTVLSIGGPPWSLASSNWPGRLACARVYNRALSTTEVQDIFNNTRRRFNV